MATKKKVVAKTKSKTKKITPKKTAKKSDLTVAQKKEIAIGLVRGDKMAFNDEMMRLGCAMPLMFADEKTIKKLTKDLGMIIGDMKNTFGRAVNGYPMFSAVQCINKADWKDIFEMYKKKREALEA